MPRDSKFAFLKSRQAETLEPADGTPAAKPAAASTSEQFGRRADPAYAQINANVPADLRRRLRVKLAENDRTLQEVLELLIDGYVDDRFKV